MIETHTVTIANTCLRLESAKELPLLRTIVHEIFLLRLLVRYNMVNNASCYDLIGVDRLVFLSQQSVVYLDFKTYSFQSCLLEVGVATRECIVVTNYEAVG